MPVNQELRALCKKCRQHRFTNETDSEDSTSSSDSDEEQSSSDEEQSSESENNDEETSRTLEKETKNLKLVKKRIYKLVDQEENKCSIDYELEQIFIEEKPKKPKKRRLVIDDEDIEDKNEPIIQKTETLIMTEQTTNIIEEEFSIIVSDEEIPLGSPKIKESVVDLPPFPEGLEEVIRAQSKDTYPSTEKINDVHKWKCNLLFFSKIAEVELKTQQQGRLLLLDACTFNR